LEKNDPRRGLLSPQSRNPLNRRDSADVNPQGKPILRCKSFEKIFVSQYRHKAKQSFVKG
jgi:hypothetical protein